MLRWQTDAFFHGRTALSSSPYNVSYDTAWDHGVQQVWGLGVPAFRFLFELLARAFGQPAFPDRLTFLIAVLLCYWFLIRTFNKRPTRPDVGGEQAPAWKALRIPWVLGLLLFAPPFLTLLRARFDFYEEVVAYGYLYSLVLFAGFLRAARRPTAAKLLLLGIWAGYGVWIRPTLLFYGVVTVALATIIAWRGRVRAGAVAMLTAFGLCGALLGLSNLTRFGGFFEFGHSLNLESGLNLNTFSLKFDYPFRKEPFLSAARDELGTLFFNRKLNGGDFYASDAVWGQSPTLRWHEMYFTTYNVIHLVLLLASAALWVRYFGRLRIRWAASVVTSRPAAGTTEAARLESCFGLFAVPWALISFVFLFGFYLWCPSMSSRYNVDFLPAVMVGISALVWNAFELGLLREKAQALEWLVVTAAWVAVGIFAAKICPGYYQPAVNLAAIQQQRLALIQRSATPNLRHYELGQNNPSAGLPFNCRGWNTEDGAIKPVVTLFATDPKCVALSLFAPSGGRITPDDLAPIQAKIGLEYLRRRSVEIRQGKATIVFRGPRTPRYQTGLQVCFLKFIHTRDLGRKGPVLRLAAVSFVPTDPAASVANGH